MTEAQEIAMVTKIVTDYLLADHLLGADQRHLAADLLLSPEDKQLLVSHADYVARRCSRVVRRLLIGQAATIALLRRQAEATND